MIPPLGVIASGQSAGSRLGCVRGFRSAGVSPARGPGRGGGKAGGTPALRKPFTLPQTGRRSEGSGQRGGVRVGEPQRELRAGLRRRINSRTLYRSKKEEAMVRWSAGFAVAVLALGASALGGDSAGSAAGARKA